MHGGDVECSLCKIFVRKFRETGHRLENNMRNKSDLNRVWCVRGLDLFGLERSPVSGSCEDGNEHSVL